MTNENDIPYNYFLTNELIGTKLKLINPIWFLKKFEDDSIMINGNVNFLLDSIFQKDLIEKMKKYEGGFYVPIMRGECYFETRLNGLSIRPIDGVEFYTNGKMFGLRSKNNHKEVKQNIAKHISERFHKITVDDQIEDSGEYLKEKQIGKVLVLKSRIHLIEKTKWDWVRVHICPENKCRMGIISLHTKWHHNTIQELYKYEGDYSSIVHLKGFIYYNDFLKEITIKPTKYSHFIDGVSQCPDILI